MTLELRELRGSDIFKVSGIVAKLDIETVMESLGKGSKIENLEKSGTAILTSVVPVIIRNLPKMEKELNSFLADLANVELKVINDLSLKDYIALLKQIFEKEDLKDFLSIIFPSLSKSATETA